MSRCDNVDSLSATGLSCTVKVWRVPAIAEEGSGVLHVELLLCTPSINEKVHWEGGLSVCCEEARRDEGELRIGSDRFLDALEPEFCSDSVIVETATKSVAEINELLNIDEDRSKKVRKCDILDRRAFD